MLLLIAPSQDNLPVLQPFFGADILSQKIWWFSQYTTLPFQK